MTVRWHAGPLDDLADGTMPVAWSVAAATREERHRHARALIARCADVDAAHVRLSRTAAGAPVVDRPPGWHVSLSGRDGHCLVGAARVPIGVDREPIDDAPPLMDMLTPAETDALRCLPEQDRPRAWLRRWTIKEAHAKLVGTPLRIAPESIETRIADEAQATASFEGVSRCWTRHAADAIETVALWT